MAMEKRIKDIEKRLDELEKELKPLLILDLPNLKKHKYYKKKHLNSGGGN